MDSGRQENFLVTTVPQSSRIKEEFRCQILIFVSIRRAILIRCSNDSVILNDAILWSAILLKIPTLNLT